MSERGKRLAAAVTQLTAGRPSGPAGSGDPELRSLIEEPYTSPADAHARLGELRSYFETRDDRREVFLTIYERVTGEVADRIDRGAFYDPDWVADYLTAFANLYRRALYDYETGNPDRLPDAWQLAFETAVDGSVMAVQDAVLGINAHINYDLAFALASVGIDPDREAKYRDHRAVTEVLRGLVDETQTTLAREYTPGIEPLDEALGRVDERTTVFTIDRCRESAWRNAVAMQSRFRVRRWVARRLTHATSAGIAHLVLSSGASLAVRAAVGEADPAAVEG